MNDVMVYMYGTITGMAIVGTILLVSHIFIKLITTEWAGSQPKTTDAIRMELNRSQRPY